MRGDGRNWRISGGFEKGQAIRGRKLAGEI